MTNVLIRDVRSEDLERIRAEAATRGTSLQSYLREAVHTQAAYLRRQDALARIAERLHDHPAVPEQVRETVLDAVDAAHAERAGRLGDRTSR